jgi:hypothetical protein
VGDHDVDAVVNRFQRPLRRPATHSYSYFRAFR